MGHAGIAEVLCQNGFDWLTIDLEHSMIDFNQARELISTIDNLGVSPLVRLTSIDTNQIKRVMDHGAHGIIAPMVKSESDIDYLVDSIYYPPKGKRGVGLARAQSYGPGFASYRDSLSEEGAILVAQIEHIDAVKNLKNIIGHEEVDAFIVGPYDLSASMGLAGQFDHQDVLDALAEINSVSRDLNICSGTHVVEPDLKELGKAIEAGNKFIAYSVDFRMLDVMASGAKDLMSRKK